MVDYLKSRIRPIRYITGIISVLLMVISLGAFAIKGLNMGLDFTGGMVTEAIINHSVTKSQLMDQLQPVLGSRFRHAFGRRRALGDPLSISC